MFSRKIKLTVSGVRQLERDGVPEALGLDDEAAGEVVGVAVEVVAAWVAVGLAGVEHVPGGGED